MTKNLPLVCGLLHNSMEANCYSFGEDYILANKLIEPRYDGASTVLNEEILWITGGKSKSLAGTRVFEQFQFYFEFYYTYLILGGTVQSTEIVRLDQPSSIPGPDLPMLFGRHCMTKINENLVIIIGGDYSYSQTVLVDVGRNFSMSSGPQLIHDRWNHACGTFIYNGKPIVIVAGGYDLSSTNLSTELWDPTSGHGWIEGRIQEIFNNHIFACIDYILELFILRPRFA